MTDFSEDITASVMRSIETFLAVIKKIARNEPVISFALSACLSPCNNLKITVDFHEISDWEILINFDQILEFHLKSHNIGHFA